MYCTSCGLPRPADQEPCPACGAAAPPATQPTPVEPDLEYDAFAEETRVRRPFSEHVGSVAATPAAPDPRDDQPPAPATLPTIGPIDLPIEPPPSPSPPGNATASPTPGAPVEPTVATPLYPPLGDRVGTTQRAPSAGFLGWAIPVTLALFLVGLLVPWTAFPGENLSFVDDMETSWVFFLMLGVGVLGLIDHLRGSRVGSGVVAGVAMVFAGIHLLIFRLIMMIAEAVDSAGVGPGGWMWTVASLLGLTVFLAVSSRPSSDERTANTSISVGLGVAAAVWAIGVLTPPDDHLEWGTYLFEGDDLTVNVAIGILYGFPLLVFTMGALRRTSAWLASSLGASLAWLSMWAYSWGSFREQSSVSFGEYLNGSYAPTTIGVVAVCFLSALSLFSLERADDRPEGPRSVRSITVAVALVAAPLAGVYGLATHEDRSDAPDAYEWEYGARNDCGAQACELL